MARGEVRSNKIIIIINNTEYAHSTYICYSLLHLVSFYYYSTLLE